MNKSQQSDSPPNINNREPTTYLLNHKIGDIVNFYATATDSDEDEISYKTLKDGIQVNDSNAFVFNINDIGNFLVQIIAYNELADTAEWRVNVENQLPVIDYTFGNSVRMNEDEVIISDTLKTIIIYDNEDSSEVLRLELAQSNPDLIKIRLEQYYLIVEDYLQDGNGESEIILKVTDSHGAVTEKSFKCFINPMTDIVGNILDSDTWEPNTTLQGFVIIQSDTVWTDITGKYKTQIDPISNIDIEAGYRSLDKTQPMSFITTARNITANNDNNDADIMVATYLNNNMTPEEFTIFAWETNFGLCGNMNYTGVKVPSVDMRDLIIHGNPNQSQFGDEYLEFFTEQELENLIRTINDSIYYYLKYPFPLIDTTYYDGIYQDKNICIWKKESTGNPSIGSKDYDSDGIIDCIGITLTRDIPESELFHNWFIAGILEEGYSSRGMFGFAYSPELEGKTGMYEFVGGCDIKSADIKFIRFIEGVAHEIGYLKPKMPLDDVLKIQE